MTDNYSHIPIVKCHCVEFQNRHPKIVTRNEKFGRVYVIFACSQQCHDKLFHLSTFRPVIRARL